MPAVDPEPTQACSEAGIESEISCRSVSLQRYSAALDEGAQGNSETLSAEQRAQAKKNYYELIRTAGFPIKPDGEKMVYQAAVKTGVIFEASKNKKRAKEFVAFLLRDENLTPYVEGSLGRWYPVTKKAAESPFGRLGQGAIIAHGAP